MLSFLFSRLAVFSVLILIQFLVLVFIILKLSASGAKVLITFQLISLCVVVWIVSKDDNPSYKLAWVIAILTLPILGGVFYIMWGNKHMPLPLRNKIERFYKKVVAQMPVQTYKSDYVFEKVKEMDKPLSTRINYINKISGYPVWENTSSEYFPLGEDKFKKLLAELKNAQRFIFMEYFIIQEGQMWNPILEVLKEKVKNGVEVRVMFDDMGCVQTLPNKYAQTLESFGIQTAVFNPFKPHLNMAMNYRDHRKICVIDGNIGFCGGINLADEYINAYDKHGHWKDTAVMLSGDAVWNLTTMFLTVWDFTKDFEDIDYERYKPTQKADCDGFVQPFGDSPLDDYNVAETIYMQTITRANDYVYITTPYLIIDNEMITALKIAAESGVDVRIVTPHNADKWYVHTVTKSYYATLIQSGVKIYEYTPGFIHAKMFVSDDTSAVVGTTNMDYRSFYLHFECGVCFYYSKMVDKVKQDILQTMEKCEEITLEKAKDISLFKRMVRAVIKIFAPMM
ncbi:MAG: cardiolipin synthase [Oscillospiraceae bacterium]